MPFVPDDPSTGRFVPDAAPAPANPYDFRTGSPAGQAAFQSDLANRNMRAAQEEQLNPAPNPFVQSGDDLAQIALQVTPPAAAAYATMGSGAGIPLSASAIGAAGAFGNRAAGVYRQLRGLPQPEASTADMLKQDLLAGGVQAGASLFPVPPVIGTPMQALRNPVLAAAAQPAAHAAVSGLTGGYIDALYQQAQGGEIDWGQVLKAGGVNALIGAVGQLKTAADVYGGSMAVRANLLRANRLIEQEQAIAARRAGAIDIEGAPVPVAPDIAGELPASLKARIADKTPEQAAKAVREEAKLVEDPKAKAKLIDAADRLDNHAATLDAVGEQASAAEQARVDAEKGLQVEQKRIQDQQDAAQKAQDDHAKLLQQEAKNRGEQTAAIMEANTPPDPLAASKPMVLANSASQTAKSIENNPESAQAQLNSITAPAQPQPPVRPDAPVQPTQIPQKLAPIPKAVGVEYLGKKHLVMEGVGQPVDQWQIKIPGEDPRGVTLTADQIREFGYEPPKVSKAETKRIDTEDDDAIERALSGGVKKPDAEKEPAFNPEDPRMYLMADKPAFREWFGGSKVVHPDGKPIVLYHGSNRDIGPEFKAGKEGGALGNGIYLTPDPKFAALYTGMGSGAGNEVGSNITPVFASLKNPLVVDSPIGKDPAIILLEKLGMSPEAAAKLFEKAYDQHGYITNHIRARAVKQGYDGIMQYRDGALREVVAFRPTQVKSSIGNNGNFNPAKPSILETADEDQTPAKTQSMVSGESVFGKPGVYEQAVKDSPVIKGTVSILLDSTNALPAEFKQQIADHPVVSSMTQEIAKIQNSILKTLARNYPGEDFGRSKFGGIVLGHNAFGLHVTDDPKAMHPQGAIYHDMFRSWDRAVEQSFDFLMHEADLSGLTGDAEKKFYEANAPEMAYKFWKAQTAGIALHEALHQTVHSEGEPLARALTFKAGDLIESMLSIKDSPISKQEYDEIYRTINQISAHLSASSRAQADSARGVRPSGSGQPSVQNLGTSPEGAVGAPEENQAPAGPAPQAQAEQAGNPTGFEEPIQRDAFRGYQPPPDDKEARKRGSFRRRQQGSADAGVVGTVAGSAIGGAYGYLSAEKRKDETDEQFQARRLLRAALFFGGGGFAGASAGRLLGRSKATRNAETLVKIQNEARGIDSVPQWFQKLRQTAPMVKFREAINNSRAIVKDVVGNAAQAGSPILDIGNPYAAGKVYAAKVAEAQRKAKNVMDGVQKGVVSAGQASGIGVDNFINTYNAWLEALHTPAYNAQLAKLHADVGGVGPAPTGRLTDAEAAQIVADAKTDGLEPVFNQLRPGYQALVESIRDVMEKGGLITAETRRAWEQKFPNYVPMNRVLPEDNIDSATYGHIGGGPGLSVLGSGVKRITGSEAQVADIAGNLMANWNDAITRVEKNEVAKAAGYFFKNLEFDGTPADGVEVRSPKVIGSSGDSPIFEQFRPETMVSYMVNGKPQWIVFHDPRMATAFSNLNTEQQNRLMRLIATPTRVMSRLFTGYNLDFLVPNVVRDRQSAAWKALSQGDTEGALQQINPVKMGADPAVVSQWIANKQTPDTALFQQMMDDGGMPGGFASSTREKAQQFIETLRAADTNKAVWTWEKTKQFYNFLSEISEGSTRYRAYKRALDLGATRQEAAVQALNSSIDFNQKGTMTSNLGAFYAFFNPAAQGGVNAVKNLLRSKDAMATLMAGLVGVSAAVDSWNKSFDPEWKHRKAFAYARTNGIPVIYGQDPETKELKYFSIPLSQELRPVKAVVDFGLDMSNGEIQSGDNLKSELARVGGAVVAAGNPLGASPLESPLSTITPTVARPLLDIAANKDYAGRAIIPDRLHESPLIQPHAQRQLQTYDSRTGRMAIALADLLKKDFNVEVSPEHMKYLVNSYAGGPARLVSSAVNTPPSKDTGIKASDLPVVGSFVRRASTEGMEKTSPLYQKTQEQLSDAKTAGELALQQSQLFFRHTFDKVPPDQWPALLRKANEQGLIPNDPVFRKQLVNDLTDKIKGRGDVDKLVGQFGVENGERAAYYASRKRDFKTEQEYYNYLKDQQSKKLLTSPVIGQIQKYLAQQK